MDVLAYHHFYGLVTTHPSTSTSKITKSESTINHQTTTPEQPEAEEVEDPDEDSEEYEEFFRDYDY